MSFFLVTIELFPVNPGEYRIETPETAPAIPADARVVDEHLTQWLELTHDATDRVTARYLFDARYHAAHPESTEAAHLAMFQALLTAKLFDDGELVVTDAQLHGSLLWPATDTPRASLARRA